ncbi:hypothetical protein YC2023_015263 [Brassica napus]
MQALKSSLNLTKDVDWSNPNPCKWPTVQCDESNIVTRIQLKTKGIQGTLTELIVLELFQSQISPTLSTTTSSTLYPRSLPREQPFLSLGDDHGQAEDRVRHEVMGGKGKKGNVHFRNRGCKEVHDTPPPSILPARNRPLLVCCSSERGKWLVLTRLGSNEGMGLMTSNQFDLVFEQFSLSKAISNSQDFRTNHRSQRRLSISLHSHRCRRSFF